MEQITFNPNNEPYYSEDFIKGFKCGAERQFEADKKDRPQGEWISIIEVNDFGEPYQAGIYCSECGETFWHETNFCPYCGADMRESRERRE